MELLDLNDPVESTGPATLRGAPAELSGPEVMRPVVGRTGGSGPELWRELGIPPP